MPRNNQDEPNSEWPYSASAERTVLGAIMLDNRAFFETTEIGPEDFFLDSHRRIFWCMALIIEEQGAIDIITVVNELEKRKEVEAVGGISYVSSLIDGVPHQPSIASYVKILRDKALLRRAIVAGVKIRDMAAETYANAEEVVANANSMVLDLTLDQRKKMAEPLSVIMPRVLRDITAYQAVAADRDAIGFRTGVTKLDKTTTGYRKKEFILISGGPGDGKTSMAVQCIIANLFDNVPVHFFSKEMTSEAIGMRFLAAVGEIDHQELRDPRGVNMFQFEKLPKLAEDIGKWPLWVDDASGLHIREVIARIRASVKRNKIQLVVLDYIQLVHGDGKNETERLTQVSGALREVAKEENIAMVALSQYSRQEKAAVKRRPQLSDLRGSGSLEQDAHMVLAAYRPQNEHMTYLGGDEIIILKQRNGPTGLGAAVKYDTRKLLFEAREDKHRDE